MLLKFYNHFIYKINHIRKKIECVKGPIMLVSAVNNNLQQYHIVKKSVIRMKSGFKLILLILIVK